MKISFAARINYQEAYWRADALTEIAAPKKGVQTLQAHKKAPGVGNAPSVARLDFRGQA